MASSSPSLTVPDALASAIWKSSPTQSRNPPDQTRPSNEEHGLDGLGGSEGGRGFVKGGGGLGEQSRHALVHSLISTQPRFHRNQTSKLMPAWPSSCACENASASVAAQLSESSRLRYKSHAVSSLSLTMSLPDEALKKTLSCHSLESPYPSSPSMYLQGGDGGGGGGEQSSWSVLSYLQGRDGGGGGLGGLGGGGEGLNGGGSG
eukprot:scaffold117005_cov57-Phaeocystis_antarctica.AAC.3